MEKYEIVGQLGDGTYGVVLRAKLRRTGEIVAIKRMKQRFRTFEECTRLPEVIALRKLHSCPHVVRLRELFREPTGELSLVFDFMDCDLLAVIRKNKQLGIPQPRIRSMCFQVVQGLAAIHKLGYFHRDMKPENLLVKRDPNAGGAETVKLADLGLVKEIRARPPFTDYVSTRWYRAPEILLQDKAYNSPVDMWALGCIMIELFTGRPLFPGANEQDQLFKIVTVLGAPTQATWPEGLDLARRLQRRFTNSVPTPLSQLFPSIPAQALDLITKMLAMNPRNRITAAQALNHPYLQGCDAESTPRPQVLPRSHNTAPSPYTKSGTVDWRDVSASKPAGTPAGHVQQQQPSQVPGGFGGASSMAGGAKYGAGSGAPAPQASGASGTVDVLKYSSPYGRRAVGAGAGQLPPSGPTAARYGAFGGTSGATPSRDKLPVASGGGSSTRRNAWDTSTTVSPAPAATTKPAAASAAPAVPSPPAPQYGAPAAATTTTSTAAAGGTTSFAGTSSMGAGASSLPSVAAAGGSSSSAAAKNSGMNLRDSFENLFKAAGIDVDEIMSRPDASASKKPAPTAKRSPTQAGAPRSPTTVGGGLTLPTRRTSPPGSLDATPTTRAPDATTTGGGSSASRVLYGRRAANGASPDGAENRAPFTVGDSPLSKLLGQSRYRAGSSSSGDGAAAATAVDGGSSGQRQTFKSPSFARKPSPLSVSVLQMKAASSSNALSGSGSSGAAAVSTSAASVLDALLTNTDAAYRQLFADEPPPGQVRQGVLQHGPGGAGSGAGGGATHHHVPLRGTGHHLHHLPPTGGGASGA